MKANPNPKELDFDFEYKFVGDFVDLLV